MIEYTNSEIEKAIDETIHSQKYRYILKRRLIDGICYEPLRGYRLIPSFFNVIIT